MKEFKTQDDLLEHYWSAVVPMAREHGVKPWECVLLNGKVITLICKSHPDFDSTVSSYKFAIAILEGKPVFVGTELYHIDSGKSYKIRGVSETSNGFFIIDNGKGWGKSAMIKAFTWTPFTNKRTFVVNGVELPCPLKKEPSPYDLNYATLCENGHEFYFESCEDKTKWRKAFSLFLTEARDKE